MLYLLNINSFKQFFALIAFILATFREHSFSIETLIEIPVEAFFSLTNEWFQLFIVNFQVRHGSKLIEPLAGKLIAILLSDYEAFAEAHCYQVRAQGLARGRS